MKQKKDTKYVLTVNLTEMYKKIKIHKANCSFYKNRSDDSTYQLWSTPVKTKKIIYDLAYQLGKFTQTQISYCYRCCKDADV